MSQHARAIIFDCDGTLVDSERIGIEVMAELAGEHGAPFDPEMGLRAWRGMKMAECVALIEAHTGVILPERFVPEFRARSADAFRTRLLPIEGAHALLASITVPFCVASSGPREKIELSLDVTGLRPFFGDRIYSAYEVGHWKPHPGLFLHAAAALGFAPADCIVIEDSQVGVEAGLNAGMRVVAFGELMDDLVLPPSVRRARTHAELGATLAPLLGSAR